METVSRKQIAEAQPGVRDWLYFVAGGVGEGDAWRYWKKSSTSNTWACYQIENDPTARFIASKAKPIPTKRCFECQTVTLRLIKIPNVKPKGVWGHSLFLSLCPSPSPDVGQPRLSSSLLPPLIAPPQLLQRDAKKNKKQRHGRSETIQVLYRGARNSKFRDEVGVRHVVMRRFREAEKITKTMIMAINCTADTSSCLRTP